MMRPHMYAEAAPNDEADSYEEPASYNEAVK